MRDEPWYTQGRWWWPTTRGGRIGLSWTLFWLIFLGQTIISAVRLATPQGVAAAALLALVAFLYARTIVTTMAQQARGAPVTPLPAAIWPLAAMAALTALAAWLIGQPALDALPYLAVTAALPTSARVSVPVVAVLVIGSEVASRTVPGWQPQEGLTFSILLSSAAASLGMLSIRRGWQNERIETEKAALQVQEERNRMARDLHDILGHSLTVLTMKAELAGRLIDVDLDRAKAEIADIETLSRSALSDVRRTVSGYREMSLAGEIANARLALQAAGIRGELPGAVDEVSADLADLFAWTVREATTNVIRHSEASTVTMTAAPTRLTVVDDGVGMTSSVMGNGLTGLQERARAVGAQVTITAAHQGADRPGCRLEVSV